MSYNQTMSTGMNSHDEREESFFSAHYTVLAVSAVLGSVMLGVVSFWLREVCYDRFGIEFCSGTISTARRREIRRFQLRAMQLQRQMERDLLDSSVSKQNERKRKYGAFLQKFCKVLSEDDFVEEIEDSNETEPQTYMRICPHGPCKDCAVEALCIICFKDYEVGEQVVWSSGESCRHVYHHDCMLKWLSTGKRICPVCRHDFVPDLSAQVPSPSRGDSLIQTATEETEASERRGPNAV